MTDPSKLARRLAALNKRWQARTPLPNGKPLTYHYYRFLMQCVIREHIEGHHADE